MAGNRQQSRFLALVSSYDEYAKTLQIAEDSEGQGAVQYLKTMDSISTKVQEVKTAWQQLYASLGLEKVIKGALDIVTKIVKQLSSFKLGALISSLVQNFIVLKKVLKLAFNSGENQLKTFTQKFNETKDKMQEPIQITLDTSKAEQQADTLAAKVANAKQGVATTGTAPIAAATTNNENAEMLAITQKLFGTKQFKKGQGIYRNIISGRMKYDPNSPYFKGISEEEYSKYQAYAQQQGYNQKTGINTVFQSFQTVEANAEELGKEVGFVAKAKEWVSVPKHLSALAMGAQILGSAMQAASLAINTTSDSTTEWNKIVSGAGSIISGAGMGMSLGNMLGHPIIGAAIGAAISGITGAFGTIVDGLKVDYAERRKMLEEEATELTATQTEKKGEETNLKNAIQTYEELAEKQYDSAEAAQELQEHMNSMAEQYPNLVSMYDSAGNAIIDVTEAEKALAKARLETSQATIETLENELAQKQNDLDELNGIKKEKGAYHSSAYELDSSRIENFALDEAQAEWINENINEMYTKETQPILWGLLGTVEGYVDNENYDWFKIEETINKILQNPEDPEYSNVLEIFGNSITSSPFPEKSIDLFGGEKISEDIVKENYDLQNTLLLAMETHSDTIDFKLDSYDTSTVEGIYEAYNDFFDALNGSILEAEESLDYSGELLGKAEIKEQADLLATTSEDASLTEKVDEYGSLISQVGLQMLKNLYPDNLDEVVDPDNERHQKYLENSKNIAKSLTNLSEDTLSQIAEGWDDFQYFSSSGELKSFLDKIGLKDTKIINGIVSAYEEQINTVKERANSALENSSFKDSKNYSDLRLLFNNDDTFTELGTAYADKVVSFINTADDYIEDGLTAHAEALLDAGTKVFTNIGRLGAGQQESAFSIISKVNWNDSASIETAIEAMEDFDTSGFSNEEKEYWSNAKAALKEARENFLFNVETEINLAVEAYKDSVESMDDIQKYAESGMTWDEAYDAVSKLANSDYEISFDDFVKFDSATGKYLLTVKGLNALLGQQSEDREKQVEELKKLYEQIEGIGSIDENTGKFKINKDLGVIQQQQLETWHSEWLNLDADTRGEFEDYVAAQFDAIEEAYNLGTAAINSFDEGQYNDIIAKNNLRLQGFKAQEERSKKLEYASKTSISASEIKEFSDYFGELFDTNFSDLISSGAIKYNFNTAQYDIVDFKAYWEKLGLDLAENSEAYLEAYSNYLEEQIEKDNAISSNAKDELDNLLKAEVGDKVVVAYLRSILGDTEGILTDDILEISGTEDLEKLLNFILTNNKAEAIGYTVAEVQDTLLELIQNWADMLSSGIEGTLSFTDADSLSSKFGLDEDAFTQTTEGLKITTQGLYEVISQMDGLERQAAIESAAKALQDEKEEYDDIFSVMKKIAEIEEELNDDPSDERKQLLEAELAIAKEIEQTLKEADDTYNFMSRDIPSGFDDPMSAWEGYSDAIKVLYGEDWSDGRANFEDLYNMFDFIGDDILKSAEVFNNNAITAAGLIEAAADAMKIDADGEMFVDLSELGKQFGLSAENMKAGIDSGIQELAQGQIEMLDAAIGVLETVVALEELDLESDGLDFSDIFTEDGNGEDFNKNWTTGLKKVNTTLTKLGIDTEEVFIAGHSLNDWLTKTLEELETDKETYLQVMQALYSLNEEDFDPDAPPEQILASIAKNLKGETLQWESEGSLYEIDVNGGVSVKEIVDGETKYSYTIGGRTYTASSSEEFAIVKTQANNDYAVTTATGGKETTYNAEEQTIKIDEETGIQYVVTYDENGYTSEYWYGGRAYSSYEEMIEAWKLDNSLREAGITSTGSTITVGGEVYTKYTLPSGGTTFVDSNGRQVDADMLDQLALQSAGVTEKVQVPVNADLEIASVGEITFVEDAIPETGVPYNGTIKINPTQLEISTEGFDATVIAQIESYNTALSSLAALGVVSTGVTATATGVEAADTEKIKDYGTAANGLPASVDSSVTVSATLPTDILNNIITLKGTINELSNNPEVEASFVASMDANSLAVVQNVLASYGYSNEVAELIYRALDQDGTLAAVKTQIDGIEDKDITITVSLEDSAAQSAIEELTEDSTKTVYVDYQPTKVGPETDTTTTGYTVYGVDNQNGNLSRVGVYDSAEQTIEAVTAAIATGTFQDGTFEITEVKSDGSTVTITASAVDLTTGAISLGSSNSNNGNEGGTSGGNTGAQSVGLDLSGLTTGLAELETAAGTAAASISSASGELSDIDSSSLVTAAGRVGTLASAAARIPSNGAGKINTLATAINNLKSKTITADVKVSVSVATTGSGTAKGSIYLSNGTIASRTSGSSLSMTTSLAKVKGNALAGGTKRTLMGELGPELVVSGGRYFTVGNNGAEFVDLANDAIVFNHLQTKRLLSSGSSGRGVPITNERNATSLATGNAMASATAALAQLKQIRAMWQSLLDASASDLGAKAGSGGGGGGGNDEGAVEYDLERWYNLLRQIEKLEQQITYEQAKRENMRSGYKYVDSLEKELDLLEKQLAVEKELASLQYDYYLKRMEDVNSSAYGKIFTYDEEGLMQYVDGENKGLDALAKLQATDENGVLKMTAKQQLAYITGTLGVSSNDLKYKSDGTEAETDADKVQVFFDNVDSIMDELDELYDSYHEHAEKLEDLTSSQNEILQEYIDNQISLENKLLQAIEDREQAEIDRLQDEKDALEEATQDYIDGLTDVLNKEKNLYNSNQTDEETAKLQRRLAILQRSGGSTSEIKSLQDQIDSRLQDAYFQAQQDQIDAIQEASDNQLEKLQTQIDLMTEALEYQKENGLLWNEVYEMMNQWTPEQMLQFIEQYTKSYKENSAAQNQEDSEETLKEAEIWAAKRDKDARDSSWESYYAGAAYDETIKSANKTAAQEAYNTAYASGGANAGAGAANAIFEAAQNANSTETPNADDEEEEILSTQTGTISGGQMNVRNKASSSGSKLGIVKNGSTFEAVGYNNGWLKVQNAHTTKGLKDGYMKYKKYEKYYKGLNLSSLPSFSSGGDIDFTGLAMVHGSKNNPENILSAEHTRLLKEGIFSNSDHSLVATVEAIQKLANNMISSASSAGAGIIIEKAEVNIQPGTISNDYDARRAGEMALEEMVKIARKTTNRVL